MKNIKYYIWAVAGLALAACSDNTGGGNEEPEMPKQTEITFTTNVETRANTDVITELTSGKEMSVFIGFSSNSSTTSMKKFTCQTDIWKGSPTVVLPEGERATLQAVYPYSSTFTTPGSIPVNVQSQTDYLYSGPTVSLSQANPKGALTMKHALSILAFNIDKQGYSGAGKLQEITIGGETFYTEGTLNISTGSVTGSTTGSYTLKSDNTLQEGGWKENIPDFFSIPLASSGTNVNLTFKIDGKDYQCNLPKVGVQGGYKYIFRFALTDRSLVAFPDQIVIISLNADADAMPDQDVSIFSVTHTNAKFITPTLTTNGTLVANIFWGDGQKQEYAENATHTYEAEGQYTTTIEAWGVEEVSIPNLVGIEQIDLSKF